MPNLRCRSSLAIAAFLTLGTATLAAQDRVSPDRATRSVALDDLRIELDATRPRLAEAKVGVRMQFTVREAGPVLLSMAAWTPGSYEIDNYARAVSGFRATLDGDRKSVV